MGIIKVRKDGSKTQYCKYCGMTKNLSEENFHKKIENTHGFSTTCKLCVSIKMKKYTKKGRQEQGFDVTPSTKHTTWMNGDDEIYY